MAINTTHNMFLSRKMMADYVGTNLETVSISTEQDNGALLILGTSVSSPVFASNIDMNLYNANYPATIATDNIYVLDDPSVYQYNDLRINIVDPRAFSVPAKTPARAKKLNVGDEGWWSSGCFASTPTAGTSYVIPTANSNKWTVSGSLPSTSKVIGTVVASENVSVGNNAVAGFRVRIINA